VDVFVWIEHTLQPTVCHSEAFIYDDMDSQSGRSLPIIYQPFDPGDRGHWRDRGSAFDFLHATRATGARVLDLGPGDGWPSLIVAPYAGEVVGVEGSRRRAQVCAENAARLGIANARFLYVEPGTPLPFEEGSFDAATAASSLEQTPDPLSTLRELHRVLRPGGRLRIDYESLSGYRGGHERDLWLWSLGGDCCRLILFDRDVTGERVRQYGLTYALSAEALTAALAPGAEQISFGAIDVPGLESLRPALVDARLCTTIHPSGPTLSAWMRQVGFRQVHPTHSGALFAGWLFDRLAPDARPVDVDGVDALLRPSVAVVVELLAPIEMDPMITAEK